MNGAVKVEFDIPIVPGLNVAGTGFRRSLFVHTPDKLPHLTATTFGDCQIKSDGMTRWKLGRTRVLFVRYTTEAISDGPFPEVLLQGCGHWPFVAIVLRASRFHSKTILEKLTERHVVADAATLVAFSPAARMHTVSGIVVFLFESGVRRYRSAERMGISIGSISYTIFCDSLFLSTQLI